MLRRLAICLLALPTSSANHVRSLEPCFAGFVSSHAGAAAQVTLRRALVSVVGVAKAASPADATGGIWANVHAVAETAALITDVNLLAVQRARNECRAVPDEFGDLESVERDDYRGRISYAFSRQC